MEERELSKHLVALGPRDIQDPPLDQEIQMAQALQTVLVPPLILENLEIHRNQGYPEVLETQEHLSLLFLQYQGLPWVQEVPEVQSFQAFLLYPFLLYRD